MKCSLGISNFLEEISSLSHSVVFLYFFALIAEEGFLAILWNSAFSCLYLCFSPLLFTSLLFTAIFNAFLDSHFAFLHFFFPMGMVLIPISCTMSRTSFYSSSGTLSIRSWLYIYFSLPLIADGCGWCTKHSWEELTHVRSQGQAA